MKTILAKPTEAAMSMPSEQEILVSRIRAAIITEPEQREVSMFGGIAFMVHETMLVSAGKDGGLLVRVSADDHARLLDIPGASQAEMGTGRSMGPGWITVSANRIADDTSLDFWISVALTRLRQSL